MRRDGIEHRAAKVSMVTGLTTILTIGFQFVSVPVCLKYWGNETYGRWMALYAAFMLVRTLDTGFIAYVGNKINYLYHQDQNALSEHLASSITGIAIITALQLSIGVAAFFPDGIASLLGLHFDSVTDYRSRLALLVLIGTWALSGSYLCIVHRLLIPTGMMYQSTWWAMAFQVSQFVGLILAAMLHLDMLQTGLLFAFLQFTTYLASAIYIRRTLPAYYPWWRGGRSGTALKDLVSSMLLTASNLIQMGTTSGMILMVSALSGPAAVPVFATMRTLVNLWNTVSNLLTTPLFPDVVRFHATREGGKLAAICKVHWVIIGSAVNFGILVTYPLIAPMYGYWTSHLVAIDRPLLSLLLGSIVLANAGVLINTYFFGTNSLRIVLGASLVKGIISLGAGRILFYSFGLAGFGMGIMGGELLALLVTVSYFMTRELPSLSVRFSLRSLAPSIVSTASVFIFLMSEGYGYVYAMYLYPVALLGVVAAAVWGWRGLEGDVRIRLVRLIGNRFIRKDVA